jgi:hypothetical protein
MRMERRVPTDRSYGDGVDLDAWHDDTDLDGQVIGRQAQRRMPEAALPIDLNFVRRAVRRGGEWTFGRPPGF